MEIKPVCQKEIFETVFTYVRDNYDNQKFFHGTEYTSAKMATEMFNDYDSRDFKVLHDKRESVSSKIEFLKPEVGKTCSLNSLVKEYNYLIKDNASGNYFNQNEAVLHLSTPVFSSDGLYVLMSYNIDLGGLSGDGEFLILKRDLVNKSWKVMASYTPYFY